MRARIPSIGGGPWRLQFSRFWGLARRHLCVPATKTQAARVFSWIGFWFNERRLTLSGESRSNCPCSLSSGTTSSSNPLMVQLYLQINVDYEWFWLFLQIVFMSTMLSSIITKKIIAIISSTVQPIATSNCDDSDSGINGSTMTSLALYNHLTGARQKYQK